MLQQLAKVLLSVLVARLLDKVRIRSKMCVAFLTGRAIIMAATSPSSFVKATPRRCNAGNIADGFCTVSW